MSILKKNYNQYFFGLKDIIINNYFMDKKHILKLTILFLFVYSYSYSQSTLKNDRDIQSYINIPQEKVFVHHNTSLLFAGEYLYYKLYCLNSNNNLLSKVSKIAYIELVGENGESLFKHKVKLENGLGQGDFFIPTTALSGNYKLIAYTQWMDNGEKNQFYMNDMTIINPFHQNQKALLKTDTIQKSLTDVMNNKVESLRNMPSTQKHNTNGIELYTDAEIYKSRSKVSLKVKGIDNENSTGSYSMSIRKVDMIKSQSYFSAENFVNQHHDNKNKQRSVNDAVFLPEYNDEVISGKVINKETNLPAVNKEVILSILDEEYIIKMTKTNEQGLFNFKLNISETAGNGTVQVIDDDVEKYSILTSDEHFKNVGYGNLIFNKFLLSPEMKNLIVERSINSQIQNAYFNVIPDSINVNKKLNTSFYKTVGEDYYLDEYTRFPTLRETATEILENVWTKKDKNGKYVFIVRGREFDPYYGTELLPLVIVDGVYIQNHEDATEYDARKVESIGVYREEYYYDSKVFKGIVFIKTFQGDFHKTLNSDYIKNIKLFNPTMKKYYKQEYTESSKEKTRRIPDYRQQLLWIPEFHLNENQATIDFFTSDYKGDYEISLEGFTSRGKPISVRKKIKVE